MSMLGNPLTRFRESPYRLGKLVRGIPYMLRTKTAVKKRKRELEKFFAKIFKRGSFSSINLSLVPRLSKSARGGEEAESLVSAVYACASFTQILGKPYSVRASSVSKTSSLVM